MRQDGNARIPLRPDELQHPVDHIQVQFVDLPGFLQLRNKGGRGQNAFFRVDPPRQGFQIADFSADCADDRLDIDLDPFFPDGDIQVL